MLGSSAIDVRFGPSAGGVRSDRGGRRRSLLACGKRADACSRAEDLAYRTPGGHVPSERGRRHVSRMRDATAGDPRDRPVDRPRRRPKRTSIAGDPCIDSLPPHWKALDLKRPLTVSNAHERPMWEFYDRLAGSRDLATLRRRRPMEQSRRRGGRKRLPPINRSPVSARMTH